MSLSGRVGSAINLYIPYRIMKNKKVLALKGYPDTKLLGGEVLLEFCPGDCRDGKDSGDFIVGAFAVIKLDDDDGSGDQVEEDGDDDDDEEDGSTVTVGKPKSPGAVTKPKLVACKGASLWDCQNNSKCRFDTNAEKCEDEGACKLVNTGN